MSSKYDSGYIYQIKCLTTDKVYIGSSYEPKHTRISKHLTDMKGYLCMSGNLHRNYRESFQVLMNNNYVIDTYDYPCDSKEELLEIERLYIIKSRMDPNVDIVNTMLPINANYSEDDLDACLDSLPSF